MNRLVKAKPGRGFRSWIVAAVRFAFMAFAVLFTVRLSATGSAFGLGEMLRFDVSAEGICLLALCAILCVVRPRLRIPHILLGAVTTLLILAGRSMESAGSLAPLADMSLLSLVGAVGLTLLGAGLSAILFHLFDRICARPLSSGGKHAFLVAWLVILAGWLPYLICFYPGSFEWDVIVQINTYFGHYLRSNWHPFLSTTLMGNLFEIGRMLGSDGLGIFLYTLIQAAALSFGFATMLSGFRRRGVPRAGYLAILAYCAFLPLWGFLAQFTVKDVLYTGILLLFIQNVWYVLLDAEGSFDIRMLLLFVLGFAACLLRNNGFAVVLPTLAVLILAVRREKRILAAVTLALTLASWLLWTNAALPALHVVGTSVKESMSLPFQQTARYLDKHEHEVTPEDWDVIHRIFSVENPADLYDPARVDSIKNSAVNDIPASDLADYLKMWLRMGLKHPITYIEAFIAQTYGYFDPYAKPTTLPLCEFNREPEPQRWFDHVQIDAPQSDTTAGARAFFGKLYDGIKSVPFVRMLVSIGAYTWATLAATVYLIWRKKSRLLVGLVPSYLSLACCLLAPINGMLRYSIPVIAAMPMMLLAMRIGCHETIKEDPCK